MISPGPILLAADSTPDPYWHSRGSLTPISPKANYLVSGCTTPAWRKRDFVTPSLNDADLSYADFRGVEDLQGADFTGANLNRADLRGVDLSQVKGLTAQQLNQVTCNASTRFPRPIASLRDTLEC